MDQYLYIPFLGDEHPFTSYFDVHQGYKVLTHCQFEMEPPSQSSPIWHDPPAHKSGYGNLASDWQV